MAAINKDKQIIIFKGKKVAFSDLPLSMQETLLIQWKLKKPIKNGKENNKKTESNSKKDNGSKAESRKTSKTNSKKK